MKNIILISFIFSISFCHSQNNNSPNNPILSNGILVAYQNYTPNLNHNFSEGYQSIYMRMANNLYESQRFIFTERNNNIKNEILLLQQIDSTNNSKKKWFKTDTGKSLLASGILIGFGTYIHLDDSFIDKKELRDEINRYLPEFHYPLDDYIQYVPYAAVYALDAFGIKSKYKTTRKLSTMATAIALNLVVIQGMKYSIAEPRPDGSANNSFPSGHTATAFMGAHIFHKEYGHRSPFYSIAAYVLATMTGVLRQLNNRHWISDVMAGAGIGIGVTELAYFLNGKWWKDKGVNDYVPTERNINELKPSFIGAKAGFSSLVYSTDDNEPGISSKSGFKISAEGAYFFNKNIGVGGEVGFQSFPNSIDPEVQQIFNSEGYEIIPQSSGNRLYYVGPYYQLPFGKNAIGTKFLLGAISGPNTKIYLRDLQQTNDNPDEAPKEIIYAEYDPSTTFSMSTGVYYKRILNDNLSMNFYIDYNIADTNYAVTYIESIDNGTPVYSPLEHKTSNWNSYSIGISVNVMLW